MQRNFPSRQAVNVPKRATGIVIRETMMKIHRHAGRPALPFSEASKPAWIHPQAMLPTCPKQQKTAARVLNSDFLYQDP
jgi:hypothetical protein